MDTVTGYHHVEVVMGMAVSIDVHDPVAGTPGLDQVLAWLHHVDATYSPYRDDSPITRLGRGDLGLADLDTEVGAVLLECERLRNHTDGIFDPFVVPAPNGTNLDPSGYVKGWAIQRAAGILTDNGLEHLCINAGGDITVRGRPLPEGTWAIGLRDPDDPAGLAAVIDATGTLAVATSATYERGAHLIDPRTGQPAGGTLASMTVLGADLALVDAYATTAFVLGDEGLDWIADQPGYDAVTIDWDGQIRATATASNTGGAAWTLRTPAPPMVRPT